MTWPFNEINGLEQMTYGLEAKLKERDEEIAALKKQVELHCERIVGQSELLTRAAAKGSALQREYFNNGLKRAMEAMQRRADLHQLLDNKAPAHDVLRELIAELKMELLA